jgi:serine/threonine-protein kinase RsbT
MLLGHKRSKSVYENVLDALSIAVGAIVARSICKAALAQSGISERLLDRQGLDDRLFENLERRLRILCNDEKKINRSLALLRTSDNKVRQRPRQAAAQHVPAINDFERLCGVISNTVGIIVARSICTVALTQAGLTVETLCRQGISATLVDKIMLRLKNHCVDEYKIAQVNRRLMEMTSSTGAQIPASPTLIVEINGEDDIVTARSRARSLAQSLGFEHTDQIKISTAVSELGRNIVNYAGQGWIRMNRLTGDHDGIFIEAKDEGPGIANIHQILSGKYASKTGLGLGIIGCKRLMNEFVIHTEIGKGTRIKMAKHL